MVARDDVFSYSMRSYLEPQNPQKSQGRYTLENERGTQCHRGLEDYFAFHFVVMFRFKTLNFRGR